MTSVYIHIPFCKNICSYCDFAKFYYHQELVDRYLDTLKVEIKDSYQKELVKTLYVGGGTPSSLSFEQLDKLFDAISLLRLDSLLEFTFECNVEDINEKLLNYLKEKNVTRLSIGVQTFNSKLLEILKRQGKDAQEKIKLAKQYFDINVDLIYAIPGETLDDLENDLDILLLLDVDHISTYSLIIEEHTKLYIDGVSYIDEELDLAMYNLIINKLSAYDHYEISNFAKKGKESIHNLTYWNNEEYYGFGLGSSGYLKGIRYDNTKSLNKYLSNKYISNSHKLSFNEKIENEFILGLRKMKGINKNNFYQKYHLNITKIAVVDELLKTNQLMENDQCIYIPSHLLYTSNDILVRFLDINYKNIV